MLKYNERLNGYACYIFIFSKSINKRILSKLVDDPGFEDLSEKSALGGKGSSAEGYLEGNNRAIGNAVGYARERKFPNTNIFLLRKNTGLSTIDIAFKLSYPETNHGSLHGGTSHTHFGVSIPSSEHKYSIVDANNESIFSLLREKGFSIKPRSRVRRKSSTNSINGIRQFSPLFKIADLVS
ncbi:MAG: hypothetical protein Q8N95_06750 [Desulfobacterales bacterium]|nr:hypothetical protein [Desulfobacterales bacterium]